MRSKKQSEDYNLLNDSSDSGTFQKSSLKKSIFKQGEDIYRSVHQRPMQSSMWLCCYRLEKAPLLILTTLISLDILRNLLFSYLFHSSNFVIVLLIPVELGPPRERNPSFSFWCSHVHNAHFKEPASDRMVDQIILLSERVAQS